jgi:hypothetical protein
MKIFSLIIIIIQVLYTFSSNIRVESFTDTWPNYFDDMTLIFQVN